MQKRTAIDSGPLMALFDGSDHYHTNAIDFIRRFKGRLVTTVAVLTEVMYLLSFSTKAQLDFLQWIMDGAVDIVHVDTVDMDRIRALIEKYADMPMDFADATLVAICEQQNITDIASVDSDFDVFRTAKKKSLSSVFPR